MPRKPRHEEILPGFPHHVILRGNNRRNLFGGNDDRMAFLRFMLESAHRDACLLYALAMMTNHVHLILVPSTCDALAAHIQSFAQRYAQRRNQMRGGSGKVFEQRYAALPIVSERQLAATTAYVDLNPVRVGRPSTWTTFALHAGGPARELVRELWTPSPWWSGLGADDATRQRAYRDFATLRQEAWAPDVVQVSRARGAPDTTTRDTRPDGSRVGEAIAPWPSEPARSGSRQWAPRSPMISGGSKGGSDPGSGAPSGVGDDGVPEGGGHAEAGALALALEGDDAFHHLAGELAEGALEQGLAIVEIEEVSELGAGRDER
jgi:putative transposase